MVIKMMRWRPWPSPLVTKNFVVKLVIHGLEGYDRPPLAAAEGDPCEGKERLAVEITWKGGGRRGGRRMVGLMGRRRGREGIKRNYTREERVGEDGGVSWEEEFENACCLATTYKENTAEGGAVENGRRRSDFLPWIIGFTVFKGMNQQQLRNKVSVIGTTSLNLSEFTCSGGQKDIQLSLPLSQSGDDFADSPLLLSISLGLMELRASVEGEGAIVPVPVPCASPLQWGEVVSAEKDDQSALKTGFKKVKMLTNYVTVRRPKKAPVEEEGSQVKCSPKSEDGDYPFDSDSLDHSNDEESSDESNKENSGARILVGYGTLAYANSAGGANARVYGKTEDWVYYSNRHLDEGASRSDDPVSSVSEKPQIPFSRRGILSWRKRKLSFRSPKVVKGEPLLKKAYAEEGGDDIDFDRRGLSFDESISQGCSKNDEDFFSTHRSSMSEFGEECFEVGTWEHREITSRDGHMKLKTEVFFASIDQRSERAAGESACTALVAVIADWFQTNREFMPIKSQFDSLIRDGSLEWRKLCENEAYKERFPDKHFDLDTVLEAQIRPLSVDPGKSFVGFFHPDGEDDGDFDILQGAMSFDNIWDEICRGGDEPRLYIVSWNDHFFILMVEKEAYHIVDTLGERLFEGCHQAYILKFGDKTTISREPKGTKPPADEEEPTVIDQSPQLQQEEGAADAGEIVVTEVVSRGKDSCKDYIKNFLAAIPMRELLADIKKDLMSSTPLLHRRLQIEFHYTRLSSRALPLTLSATSP